MTFNVTFLIWCLIGGAPGATLGALVLLALRRFTRPVWFILALAVYLVACLCWIGILLPQSTGTASLPDTGVRSGVLSGACIVPLACAAILIRRTIHAFRFGIHRLPAFPIVPPRARSFTGVK